MGHPALHLSPRGPLCSFYSYASRTITVGPKGSKIAFWNVPKVPNADEIEDKRELSD